MSYQEPAGSILAPTSPEERIEALDLLRGFAIVGMFAVHMTNLFWGDLLEEQGPTTLDEIIRVGGEFLFSTKAFSLFGFLFGFGFALQLQRARYKRAPFVPLYLRRTLGLFIIGNLTMLLGINNDVLVLYAMFALVLFLVRNFSNRSILLLAVLLVINYIVIDTLTSVPEYFGDSKLVQLIKPEAPSVAQQAENLRVYTQGTYGEFLVLRFNKHVAWWTSWQHFIFELELISIMLAGMLVARMGWLHDIEKHASLFRRVLPWALAIGLVLTALGEAAYELRHTERLDPALWLPGNLAFYPFGSWPLVIAYASTLVLLSLQQRCQRILAGLAAIGRMALSNFVLTYIPFMFIAYGWGLGLYGKASTTQMFLVLLVQLPLQALLSEWWLQRFRFGPLEWLWRSFTYAEWQPVRRAAEQ
jgi:uncharacterized protein